MADMIEHMAKRIAWEVNFAIKGVPGRAEDVNGFWDRMPETTRERYLSAARAAIRVMREPTTEMIAAGAAEFFGGTNDDEAAHLCEVLVSGAYTVMIDTALATPVPSA